jgi:hypothetical protein
MVPSKGSQFIGQVAYACGCMELLAGGKLPIMHLFRISVNKVCRREIHQFCATWLMSR